MSTSVNPHEAFKGLMAAFKHVAGYVSALAMGIATILYLVAPLTVGLSVVVGVFGLSFAYALAVPDTASHYRNLSLLALALSIIMASFSVPFIGAAGILGPVVVWFAVIGGEFARRYLGAAKPA